MKVAIAPHSVRTNAANDCTPNKYQPPPKKRPERSLVVPNETFSAKSPTAITPQMPHTP